MKLSLVVDRHKMLKNWSVNWDWLGLATVTQVTTCYKGLQNTISKN